MTDIKKFNKPNFFILGAAKSGTTSLYHFLDQHPKIFMSKEKEPTFFCEDFQVVRNPIHYFELYDNVTDHKAIGEASHGYFSDPKSPRLLKALFPDAKFIITLRNPAERAFSLYQHMRRFRFEKISSFEKALENEESRFHSKDFKRNNGQYFYNFMYYRSGLYGEQIQRYFSLFEREQFHIITLNDIRNNFDSTIKGIWDFLEVEPMKHIEPEVFNKGYTVKYYFLDRLINNKFTKNTPFEKLGHLTRGKTKKLKSSTRDELMSKYTDDQEKLYNLIGIKFT